MGCCGCGRDCELGILWQGRQRSAGTCAEVTPCLEQLSVNLFTLGSGTLGAICVVVHELVYGLLYLAGVPVLGCVLVVALQKLLHGAEGQ